MKIKFFIFFCFASGILKAQQEPLQFFRPNNKTGLNVFEPTKNDTTPFTGIKVRVGGNFTQVAFNFAVTPTLVLQGLIWALGIGFIGGLFPAVRAARLPVTEALRG